MKKILLASALAAAALSVGALDAILMRQRTMNVNALRGHLAEFGIVGSRGAKGLWNLVKRAFSDDAEPSLLPPAARIALSLRFHAPSPLVLQCQLFVGGARHTHGKERLGDVSKMGDKYLRTLLVVGATSVIRYARGKNSAGTDWINRLLAKKSARLVSVALANKTARIAWALLVKKENYRAPVTAAAA